MVCLWLPYPGTMDSAIIEVTVVCNAGTRWFDAKSHQLHRCHKLFRASTSGLHNGRTEQASFKQGYITKIRFADLPNWGHLNCADMLWAVDLRI